jgi:hypothetical protein
MATTTINATLQGVIERQDSSGAAINWVTTTRNAATGSVSDPNFISYENLTENVVFGWITGSIDTASIELQNSGSIASRINEYLELEAQKTASQGLPW